MKKLFATLTLSALLVASASVRAHIIADTFEWFKHNNLTSHAEQQLNLYQVFVLHISLVAY